MALIKFELGESFAAAIPAGQCSVAFDETSSMHAKYQLGDLDGIFPQRSSIMRQIRTIVFFVVVSAAGVLSLNGNALAAESFEGDLGPAPYDDATRMDMAGQGRVTATLDGSKLTISGAFDGLKSPATVAQLRLGRGIAVPGASLSELTIRSAPDSDLSGTVTLTASQIKALHAGWLYIQVESAKLPAPFGNLWGWLFPQREKIADGVVEHGKRFLPQLDLPRK